MTVGGCEGITVNINLKDHVLENFTYGAAAGSYALSGMMDGGRIYLHLKDNVEDKYLELDRHYGEFSPSSRLVYGEWDTAFVMGMPIHVGVNCAYLRTFTFMSPDINVTYQVHDD